MPSGRVHAATSALTAAALTVSIIMPDADPELTAAAALGCWSGVFLSPDLDVDNGYIGFSIARKYLGSIVQTVWQLIWKPYAIAVPHRSKVSHVPALGTALRLLYLYVVYFVIATPLMLATGWPRTVYLIPVRAIIQAFLTGDVPRQLQLIGACFVGLCISDTLHAIMDVISTALKKITFRRRRAWQLTLSDVGNVLRNSKSNTR